MEIFKKVSEGAKTISESAKTIGKKSGELVEATRLKFEIAKLEKEMENNLSALGNLVYMQHKGEQGMEEEVKRLLQSTQALEADIEKLQDQLDRLQPKPPVCPDCRTELPVGGKFCPNCGVRVVPEKSDR
ncbi:MAG: zinc ribbon domain-containing protein [Peptococcaceae bacterium]|nr:MAG: zinc ribbon domain-containing protein [Peptococcaceae bacterium]